MKKAELLLDKSFRTGIVEYHFDAEGIETISQMGYSKNYWTAFKEYGTMGQYIYVKRKDNKMVLIDKNDLSTGVHIPQELRIRSRGTERHSASN